MEDKKIESVETEVEETKTEEQELGTLGFEYPNPVTLTCGDIEIVMTKPYITHEMKMALVEELKDVESPLERTLEFNSILLGICCGITEDLDYDVLKINGVFDKIREVLSDDIEEIEEAVEDARSLENSVKVFLEQMATLADKTTKKLPSKKKIDAIADKLLSVKDMTELKGVMGDGGNNN